MCFVAGFKNTASVPEVLSYKNKNPAEAGHSTNKDSILNILTL